VVRFTLRDCLKEFSIKMDVPGDSPVSDLREVVSDMWGEEGVLFVNGYQILDQNMPIGKALDEGDVIDILPDLRKFGKD
jgi:hypothetical protein